MNFFTNRLFLIITLILLVCPSMSFAASADSRKGESLLQEGKYLEAREVFLGQALRGDLDAQTRLIQVVREYNLSRDCFTFDLIDCYERNDSGPVGMNNLGMIAYHGLDFSEKTVDYNKVRTLWLKAAIAGNVDAMFNLGVFWDQGRGTPQDLPQARFWYEKAAKAGHPKAMFNFGNLCYSGKGGPQDLVQARFWYVQAAKAGYSKAMNNVAVFFEQGLMGVEDLGQAHYWYEQAAKAGHPKAMFNLALLLAETSVDVDDLAQARYWHKQAVKAGHPIAKR